jgi:hypothetical protein
MFEYQHVYNLDEVFDGFREFLKPDNKQKLELTSKYHKVKHKIGAYRDEVTNEEINFKTGEGDFVSVAAYNSTDNYSDDLYCVLVENSSYFDLFKKYLFEYLNTEESDLDSNVDSPMLRFDYVPKEVVIEMLKKFSGMLDYVYTLDYLFLYEHNYYGNRIRQLVFSISAVIMLIMGVILVKTVVG